MKLEKEEEKEDWEKEKKTVNQKQKHTAYIINLD